MRIFNGIWGIRSTEEGQRCSAAPRARKQPTFCPKRRQLQRLVGRISSHLGGALAGLRSDPPVSPYLGSAEMRHFLWELWSVSFSGVLRMDRVLQRCTYVTRTAFPYVVLSLGLFACGSSNGGSSSASSAAATEAGVSSVTGSGGTGDTDNNTDASGDATMTGGNVDEPHALGTIVLAEQHGVGAAVATGSVTATFIPDAAISGSACTQAVAGCEISRVPSCAAGCGEGQFCGFDDACASVCVDICDAECGNDEVCYFAAPGQAACRESEDFDAGVLTFSGTTTPITLLPPYVLTDLDTGSPFSPGAMIGVEASGAATAGLAPFDVSFAATNIIQTDIDAITVTEAYGDGDMPVSWSAGSDDVLVTVTVAGALGGVGTVMCAANDASGNFEVPRAAMDAALEEQALASVSVRVQRTRTDLVMGLSTVGELLFADVQEAAWLQLVSSSTEFGTVEGCAGAEVVCGGECVDVLFDADNCGDCGVVCDACIEGECGGEVGPYEGCDPDGIILTCPAGSECIPDDFPPTASVCAQANCSVPADCPAAPPGSTVACVDLGGAFFCILACMQDSDCPDGATCAAAVACVYPL